MFDKFANFQLKFYRYMINRATISDFACSAFLASIILSGSLPSQGKTADLYNTLSQQLIYNALGEAVTISLSTRITVPKLVHKYFAASVMTDVSALIILRNVEDPAEFRGTLYSMCVVTYFAGMVTLAFARIRYT